MNVHLYRRRGEYRRALSDMPNGYYALFGSQHIDPKEIFLLEEVASNHNHIPINDVIECRELALKSIISFFKQASAQDTEFHYSFTSRIPLAIPNYHDIQQIFLLLQINRIFSDKPILVLVQDRQTYRLIHEIIKSDLNQRNKIILPNIIAYLRFFRTLLRTISNHILIQDTVDILIFTLASKAPTQVQDSYFGNLSEKLATKRNTLTVYSTAGPSINSYRTSYYLPLEAYASTIDVLKSFLHSFLSGFRMQTRQTFEKPEFRSIYIYLCIQERKNGETFMQQFYKRAFQKMMHKTKPKVLVYPFENRNWEKHLLNVARLNNIYCIAYQHSSITPRHLAFDIENEGSKVPVLPDKIITVGQYTASDLKRSAAIVADRLIEGASMRRVQDNIPPPERQGILVAISSNRNEALSLIKIIYEAVKFIKVPIIIRTHPTIPIDDIFSLFQWPENVRLSKGTTLKDDLRKVSMVVYSSSTVALEGMLFQRLPIYVDIGDLPSGDPLPGKYPFKYIVKGAGDLPSVVEIIVNTDIEELQQQRHDAELFADTYLKKAGEIELKNMLETIVACA